MRVDADAFTSVGSPTTAATLAVNLPADDAVGATENYTIDVFDSAAKQRSLQLSFAKQEANAWSVVASGGPDATVTITPNSGLVFDAAGELTSPSTYSFAVTFADDPANPTTAAFTLDVGGFTQFAGSFLAYDYGRDGYAPGALSGVTFNDRGEVIGRFDNGRTKPLYRWPSPTSSIPTALCNSRATSTPSPGRRDSRWSRRRARRGWAKSARARWRSRTSIWPESSPG